MKFGRVAVAAAEGLILAHSVRGPGFVLRKGDVIDETHIAALEAAGIEAIVGARAEAGDAHEDEAAQLLATVIGGAHVRLDRPHTGRCNLFAEADGLLLVEAGTIDAINAVDEAMTVATLRPLRPVVAGEMIATVKIIPFAVPRTRLDEAQRAVARPAVSIAPFQPLRVGVISTLSRGLKPSTIDKTMQVMEARLDRAGATLCAEARVAHEVQALSSAIRVMDGIDTLIVFGASAITDRRDVVPVAVELAGGVVEHVGMPVDPGNLLLLGRIADARGRSIPVIGAPGCARSPKENGFDFVLWHVLAGLPIGSADLRRMGVGGLLSDIAARPQRRRTSGDG